VVSKFYEEKLKEHLDDSFNISYMNHPNEGYYYFIYDSNKFDNSEAIQSIEANL
jgi:hypothetical protein